MAQYPSFASEARNQGDKRGIVYQHGMLDCIRIDLSNANALQELTFKGDVVYVDKDSTGSIGVKFDMAWPRFFPLGANGAIRGIPYEQLLLNWTAQPGLFVNLWFGYGVDIVAPNQDITSIGSIINPVTITGDVNAIGPHLLGTGYNAADFPLLTREVGARYASTYSTLTLIGSNAPQQVFAPGTNTNGAIIHDLQYVTRNDSASMRAAFVAHTSAPVSTADGDVLLSSGPTFTNTPGIWQSNHLTRPLYIAAGKGLWFIVNVAETDGQRSVLYTLL